MTNDYFSESEIKPVIETLAKKLQGWYSFEDLSLKLPNFHNLACHLVDQVQFLGPPWAMSTQLDEHFHQSMKSIFKNKMNGFSPSKDCLVKV